MEENKIIIDKLNEVLERVTALEQSNRIANRQMLTLNDVMEITSVSRATIMNYVRDGKIPCYKPSGHKLYFDKTEIYDWMKHIRMQSQEEAEQEAINRMLNEI